MTDESLEYLNMARRWWLATMPYIGRVPEDDEVLAAYKRYHDETGSQDTRRTPWARRRAAASQ